MVTKVVVGVAGATILTSAGVSSYFLLTRETEIEISKLMLSEYPDKVILSTANKANNLQSWTNYKNSNRGKKASEDAWELNEWKGDSTDLNAVPDGLITKCGQKVKEKVKGKEDLKFKNFVSWCLVNK